MHTPKTIWLEAHAPQMHHSFAVISVLSAFPLALVGEEGKLSGERGSATAGGEIMVRVQQVEVPALWCWGGGKGCFGHICRFRAGRMVQLELQGHR